MSLEHSPARTIIRGPEVCRRTGRSRTQIWRDVQANKFPAPVSLGANAIGWYEDEIDRWIADRPRVRYAPDAV